MAGIRARINAELDTSRVDMQFNKMMSRLSGKQINFNVNARSFTQPLGRITASANEFTKSLEASNARVIAFGASVGIINAVSNAFKGLVAETIKFEKTLADINVILNASNSSIQKFGSNLFDVAKNTAQSFDKVADAALEFSRQGLTMEETLKRTNDALILTRLTSLKAEEAVAGLTAAVNAFGSTGETTTSIIDKLAAVDVKFAVSSEDLINALERTGAVAIDAGVELDNLIGLVTALQQTTARGGSVIGNGLKTIFTRIQRPQSIKQLEEMGIAVRNLAGSVLPADKILVNIAKSFNKLSQAQQSNVVQFSAGIFQANIFRASLRDLAKEQNLYNKASEISANAAGNAAVKNEQLNKTISALASQSGTAIMELAEAIGELTIKPELGNMLSSFLSVVEGFKESIGSGEDEGNTFAKGLIRGVGNVLTGPALFAFGAVFIKMLANVAKFASQSLKDVLGITTRKEKIKTMEESIVNILSRNKHLQEALNELEGDRLSQEQFLLKTIEAQTNAMARQKNLAAQLAKPLLRAGVRPDLVSERPGPIDLDGDGKLDTFSGGAIPGATKDKEKDGARRGGYAPGIVKSTNIKGIGDVVYNTSEKIKKFKGLDQPAIMPPQGSKAGRVYGDAFAQKHGFDPYASSGFIPNLANQVGSALEMDMGKLTLFGKRPDIERAFGIPSLEKEFKDAAGAPIVLEGQAGLEDIVKSTGAQDVTKTRLFKPFSAIAAQKGITTIKRPFQVRTLPKGQIKDAQDAERKTANLLNQEAKQSGLKQTHTLTSGAAKNKKGRNDYPVDIIAYGSDLNSHEVKSGKFSMANIISKSLRMSSDRELATWMSLNKVSGGSALTEANFKKAQSLAGKLKIAGTGAGGEFTQDDADIWGMSSGHVPNFARMYQINAKMASGKFQSGTLFSDGLFLKKQADIHSVLMEIDQEKQRFSGAQYRDKGYGITTFQMPDQNLKAMLSGVYSANQIRKLRALSDRFLNWYSPSYINDDEEYFLPEDEHFLEEARARKKGFEYISGKGEKPIKGTKANPMPLAGQGAWHKNKKSKFYLIPDTGVESGDIRDAFSLSDEEEIRRLFELKRIGTKEIDDKYLSNLAFADMMSGGDSNKIRAAQEGGLDKMKFVKNQGLVPNFTGGVTMAMKSRIADFNPQNVSNISHLSYKALAEHVEKAAKADPGSEFDKSISTIAAEMGIAESTISNSKKPGTSSGDAAQLALGSKYDEYVKNLNSISGSKLKAHIQRGLDFEEQLLDVFGLRRSTINTAPMDYNKNEFAGQDAGTKKAIEMLTATEHGDAYAGPEGHAMDHFMAKALRELNPNITEFLKGKGIESRMFKNTKKFVDIIGTSGGKADDVVQGEALISDIAEHSKLFFEKSLRDAGYAPTKPVDDFIKANPKLKNKTLRFKYTKDFVDIKKVQEMAASSGLIPNFGVQLDDKYFDDAEIKQALAKLYKSKTGKKPDAAALDRAVQKYIALIEDTGRTYPGGDFMIGAQRVMANEVALALMNHGQFYKPKKGETVEEFSKGLIPNFANPLADAISREHAAGLPMSKIRVDQSDKLKGPLNPMGLAVTNTRDEPLGVEQGIRRAKSMRMDPKTHGASGGVVPNFISGAGVMNTDFKKFQKRVDESTRAIRENTNTVERKTDAEEDDIKGNIEGLQRLFYFQSSLSMASGFLEQFAKEGDSTLRTFSQLGMAATNITSAYIQQKELIPELMSMVGVEKDERMSIGDMFGGPSDKTKRARQRADEKRIDKMNKSGKGPFAFMNMLGKAGSILGRFVPILGQVYTGFTFFNEGLKFLTGLLPAGTFFGLEKGEGIMDLFNSSGDKAAKQIEKLGQASEAATSALEAVRKENNINAEITKLEAKGKERTIKDEERLTQLRMDAIPAEIARINRINDLANEEKVGAEGVKLYNEYLKKLGDTTVGAEEGLQNMLLVLQNLTGAKTVIKAFEDRLKNNTGTDSGSSQIREGLAIKTGRDFARFSGLKLDDPNNIKSIKEALGGASSDNILDIIADMEKEFSPEELISKLKNSGLTFEEGFDFSTFAADLKSLFKADGLNKETRGKASKDIVKGVLSLLEKSELDEATKALAEESTAAKMALKRSVEKQKRLNSIQEMRAQFELKRLSQAQAILKSDQELLMANSLLSSSQFISAEASRRYAESLKKSENETAKALNSANDAIMSSITELFVSDNFIDPGGAIGEDKIKQFDAKLKTLLTHTDVDSFSSSMERINESLGKGVEVTEEAFQNVVQAFAVDGSGIQDRMNQIQENLKGLSPIEKLIATQVSIETGITGKKEEVEKSLIKIIDEYQKSQEKIEEGRKTEERQNNEALRQLNLKQKTVQGAMELANIISRQGNIEDAIEESLMGEAAYLKVLNDSLADRVKITQESKNLEALVLERLREKSRKEAEASVFSSAEADATVRIRTGDPATLSKKELEARQNMLLISQGKVKQEISSAQLSAEDASVRKDILSSAIEAAKLAESKLSTDMDIAQGDIFLKNAKLALLADEETRRELVASTVDNEILDQQISLSLLKQRNKYLEQGKNRAKIAKIQNDTEIEQLELDTKLEAEKLKELQASGGIAKIAALQLEQSTISLEKDALIAASKQRQLDNNIELEKRQIEAQTLLDIANKRAEHRAAMNKANMDQGALSLMTGMDIESDRFNAQSNMRSAATRASITGKPEDIAAFSRAMLEFKESTQEGATAFDKLRVKMAETSVAANETGAALLASYDTLRSELKQAFKDIGSGKKSMGDAMEDVILKSLGAAFDKITEQNIDNFVNTVFKGLTGVDPVQDAKTETKRNTEALSKLTNKIDDFLRKGGGTLSPDDVKKASTIGPDIEKGKKATEFKKQTEPTKEIANIMNDQSKKDKGGLFFGKTENPALKQTEDILGKIGNLDIGGALAGGINLLGTGLTKAVSGIGSFFSSFGSGNKNFYGGQIQRFKAGGFVKGPAGVDNIPAMLSSGEYVMSRGQVDQVQKFNQGGAVGGLGSLLNMAVDLGVKNFVGRKYGAKTEDKSKPPEFDKNRLKSLGMGSTVDLGLGSSQLSGRFIAQNRTIDEYGGHLMDLHDYNVAKQNEKTNQKLTKYQKIVGSITGMLGSSMLKALPAIGGAIGGLIGGLGGAIGSGISSIGGSIPGIGGLFQGLGGGVGSLSSGLGGAVGALSSFNIPGAISSLGSGAMGATANMSSGVGGTLGNIPGVGKYLDAGVSQLGQGITGLTASATSSTSSLFGALTGQTNFKDGISGAFKGATGGLKHAFSASDKWRSKQGTRGYFMGGSVPAMLTKGESVIPSAIAKRMGYNNLKNINRSGELPIVDGPGGIDNVGPVPMTPGDFVIRRSSTQKLAKKNPHLMKLAMQNPGVFRNGGVVRGYYNGGVVGSSDGTSVVPQYDQPAANQQDQSGAMQSSDKGRGSTTNNINITVNIDEKGGEKTTSDGASSGAAGEQQLSMKIKSAVLEVIREEKRVGGELS
jgi:TP901 family phage tail tape measure protein